MKNMMENLIGGIVIRFFEEEITPKYLSQFLSVEKTKRVMYREGDMWPSFQIKNCPIQPICQSRTKNRFFL